MKSKNILDEMQDQKRLKIESFGLWIAYFSLAASIFVQVVITRESILRTIAATLSGQLCSREPPSYPSRLLS